MMVIMHAHVKINKNEIYVFFGYVRKLKWPRF